MVNESLLKDAIDEVNKTPSSALSMRLFYRLYYDAMNGNVDAAKFLFSTLETKRSHNELG